MDPGEPRTVVRLQPGDDRRYRIADDHAHGTGAQGRRQVRGPLALELCTGRRPVALQPLLEVLVRHQLDAGVQEYAYRAGPKSFEKGPQAAGRVRAGHHVSDVNVAADGQPRFDRLRGTNGTYYVEIDVFFEILFLVILK